MFPKTQDLVFSFPVSISNVQLWICCCIIKILISIGLISDVSTQIIFTSLGSKEESKLLAFPAAYFPLYIPEWVHIITNLSFTHGF